MKQLLVVGLIALSTSAVAARSDYEIKNQCEEYASDFGNSLLRLKMGVSLDRVQQNASIDVLVATRMLFQRGIRIDKISVIQAENAFYNMCLEEEKKNEKK